MKKVLIIAHLLKASPRIPGLARYLPEFGWQPIVLTAPLGGKPDEKLRIVETEYRDTLGFWKKMFGLNPNQDEKLQIKERFGITSQKSVVDFALTRVGEVVNYPDSDKGWKAFAIKTGSELIAKEGIDAIISSSSPVTAHIIASELKARHKIPWLADLRDLWSQNHNYSYSPLRKLVDKRLELKTLSTADALITVSQPWADKLSTLHKGKATYTVTNGFDPAEVNDPPVKLLPKFTITHTGSVYAGKQEPARLLAAIRDLTAEGVINPDEIEVRFYGPRLDWLEREIKEYGLSGVVQQYGPMSRPAAVAKQRESQLLLHFKWEDPLEIGAHSLKIFEYLGARRPILVTGGYAGDVVDELVEETNSGVCAVTGDSIKQALQTWYREYKSKGAIGYQGLAPKISKYSHREIAGRFSGILSRLT